MKQKQRIKENKEKTKRNQKTIEEQEEREERKEQERDRERGSEKGGGQKRQRTNKGRHSKINKNALFRVENSFSKQRKET